MNWVLGYDERLDYVILTYTGGLHGEGLSRGRSREQVHTCLNRGWSVREFAERTDAIDWLTGKGSATG